MRVIYKSKSCAASKQNIAGVVILETVLHHSLFAILSLCLLTLTACGKDTEIKKVESVKMSESIQKLPKLLDLGAHKCIPCKMMAPILEELSKEYASEFKVEFIDVWQPENKAIAKSYGIQSIPTQIFFDAKDKELWRHEGFMAKEDILKKWLELGFTFKVEVQEKINSNAAAAESE